MRYIGAQSCATHLCNGFALDATDKDLLNGSAGGRVTRVLARHGTFRLLMGKQVTNAYKLQLSNEHHHGSDYQYHVPPIDWTPILGG